MSLFDAAPEGLLTDLSGGIPLQDLSVASGPLVLAENSLSEGFGPSRAQVFDDDRGLAVRQEIVAGIRVSNYMWERSG